MKNFHKNLNLHANLEPNSNSFLEPRLVNFAEGLSEAAPAADTGDEVVAFNITPSEKARRKGAQAAAVIVKVKKDEGSYNSGGAIVKDLKKELKEVGFDIPEDIQFNNIDEVIDYVLEHTDFTLQPLTLGDIHIGQDAARKFRDLGVEFVFDEATQHIDFKFPPTVQFFDLDGNKVEIMDETDATHFVDVSISFDDETKNFLVIVGKDDDTQVRRTLKYKVSKKVEEAAA